MAGTRTGSRGSRRRLGRGLSSLMQQAVRVDAGQSAQQEASREPDQSQKPSDTVDEQDRSGGSGGPVVCLVPLEHVEPNPCQPRKDIDQHGLDALAASIRTAGVMQPILVRPNEAGGFELVAGERRWRAARLAGLGQIPAIISDLTDTQSAQWAVIENVQREDLDPIEKAEAFRSLVDRFGLTHSQVAERVGINRSSVANLIRLNSLDEATKQDIRSGRLSQGHAKALLSLQDANIRRTLAEKVVRAQWSVRRLECEVDSILNPTRALTHRSSGGAKPDHVRELEERISAALGVPARIRRSRSGTRGQIVLTFTSVEEFERLVAQMERS